MKLELIKSVDDFSKLEPAWEKILGSNKDKNFYFSYDWFHFLLRYGHVEYNSLCLISILSGKEVVGILPFWIINRRIRLSSARHMEFIANIYTPYCSAIVERGREVEISEFLIKYLFSKEGNQWDVLNLEPVSEQDNFIASLLHEAARRGSRVFGKRKFVRVASDVSPYKSSNEYFSSRSENLRNIIKRGLNNLERAGPLKILRVDKSSHEIDDAMNDYYDVYDRSWKIKEEYPTFHRNLAKYLADKDYLRLYILYHANGPTSSSIERKKGQFVDRAIDYADKIPKGFIPVGTYFFAVRDGIAYFLKSAYREDYSKYSVGNVLMWFAYRDLIDNEKVKCIDFQQGDEEYKMKWGEIKDTWMSYKIPNPRKYMSNLDLLLDNKVVPLVRPLKKYLFGH